MRIEESVRSLLDAAVAAEPPVRDGSLRRVLRGGARRLAWRRRRPALVGGLATVLALALAAGLLPRGAGGPVPAAASPLELAASAAARRRAPALGRGQFWYTRIEGTWVAPTQAAERRRGNPGWEVLAAGRFLSEEWWTPDGVSRTRVRHDAPKVLESDMKAWIDAGRPPLLRYTDPGTEMDGQQARHFISWPGLVFPRAEWDRRAWDQAARRLGELPTNPAALDLKLRENFWLDHTGRPTPPSAGRPRRLPSGAEADVAIFQAATWLLARPITPPALRAALYRVLAELDGVRTLGPATDEAGRAGVAVAVTHDGVRHEVILDPGTSLLLAARDVTVAHLPRAPGYPVGTTVSTELYRTTVVDSVDHTTR